LFCLHEYLSPHLFFRGPTFLLPMTANLYTNLRSRVLFLLNECHVQSHIYIYTYIFFSMAQQPPVGPGPPHYRGFTITLRHTTLGRAPLDERSARRTDIYLTHTTLKRDISKTTGWCDTAITASVRPTP
jgi:hypothetical protein